MTNAPKPFTLEGSKHDLGSYWGRVSHFFDLVDLNNALLSEKDISAAKGLLDACKQNKLPHGTTDAELWDAKKRVESAIHPDTGETIPLLFRMSMFMPANLPITAGMLLSGTGRAQIFWQWMNQSYNAGFNYANRNATVPVDMAGLAASYGVATGVACGMSYGLGKVVENLTTRFSSGAVPGSPQPLSLKLLSRGLPWMAVASAGMANAVAMRYKEAVDGITVYDEAGKAVGTSIAAGRHGLSLVALTRAALPVPILLLPPFILDGLRASAIGPAMARSMPLRMGIELGVFACFLQGALPFAVALFPQKGSINASALEPEFQNRGIDTYFYNKGL